MHKKLGLLMAAALSGGVTQRMSDGGSIGVPVDVEPESCLEVSETLVDLGEVVVDGESESVDIVVDSTCGGSFSDEWWLLDDPDSAFLVEEVAQGEEQVALRVSLVAATEGEWEAQLTIGLPPDAGNADVVQLFGSTILPE